MRHTILVLATILLLSACGPAGKVTVQTAAPTPEDLQAIRSAGALASRGSYIALKDACRIYSELYAKPSVRGRIAAAYFRADFLLALREKELGIGDDVAIVLAGRLTAENPVLAGYRAWLGPAGDIPLRIKGIIKDSIPWLNRSVSDDEVERLLADLRTHAVSDELSAYFCLSLACPAKSTHDNVEDRAAIRAAHPQSNLIVYRTAFCPELVTERLDAVIRNDPEFWEAYGFRAEAAMGRGELLTAENDLLVASEHIPESAYYNILLASIYFFTEEFEQSIFYCEKAIALSPEYRDAYLTKAICLSQLGRYPEAIGVLNRIIEMRYYLQGEAYYWLAWNDHALKDLETAQEHIESAKGPLPTNSEVFGLAGMIALERNEPDRAETEFMEALVYDAGNHEALLGLARIAEQREKWTEAAGFYEKAAAVIETNEDVLKAKIEEIKAAAVPESRKAKLLARKDTQLRMSETVEAAAFFNAAVALSNAGRKDAARAMAERAAEHPQFKARVAEFLEKIK
ncbi:MAG: tetratricopeptide repeat protein [Candidatus Aminicenantes bacterium]|nr:tetratricopeptide repeat protein [Candidatus Aminicenantes bacterium]